MAVSQPMIGKNKYMIRHSVDIGLVRVLVDRKNLPEKDALLLIDKEKK